ncbi:MAG: hypothetical protein RQ724_08900 [Desulfuromonadales bacterium]|nr:hypothetical protein [Desulfuromonadales bacterium]
MFKWQEAIDHLDLPAHRVLRLHQSQNQVQVALPGVPSQEAKAYVCAFSAKSGLKVTIALHLKSSNKIAFFFHRHDIAGRSAKELVQDALDYAESMGFSLSDTDYHLASASLQEKLWAESPLSKGFPPEGAIETPEEIDDIQDVANEPPDEPPAEVIELPLETLTEDVEEVVEVEDIESNLNDEPESAPERMEPAASESTANELSAETPRSPDNTLKENLGRLLASF